MSYNKNGDYNNKKPYNKKPFNKKPRQTNQINNIAQSKILSEAIKNQFKIELETLNNKTYQGKVVRYDSFVVVLKIVDEVSTKLKMFFKNNIVSISCNELGVDIFDKKETN